MELEAETVAFLGDRAALIVAAVRPDGRPYATRAWGLTAIDLGTGRCRLLLEADDADALAHLAGGGRLALTGSDVPTLRSFQLKGRVEDFEPVTEDDDVEFRRHAQGVFEDINAADHISRSLIQGLQPHAVVACTFAVDEVYDQTPGPTAGAVVKAGR